MVQPSIIFLWYKKLNAHLYWKEALNWHPALRPSILRKWIEDVGFITVKRHETKLRYYYSPTRLIYCIFHFLENLGFSQSGKVFRKYPKLIDTFLASNLAVIKWLSIRQFVLAKKINKIVIL